MEPAAFAYEVCAWLDPNALGDALLCYQQNPKWAAAPAEWSWRSQLFKSATDVGLDHLVRLFLDNFRIPPGYIRLLRSISRPDIDPAAWEWLATLRFEGSVVFDAFPPDSKPDVVALIRERNAVVLILHAPLSFLCNVVGQAAPTWLPYVGSQTLRPSLKHSGAGELHVYIESVVASRLVSGEATRVAVMPTKGTMITDYRSISYAGPYPSGLDEIEPLRNLAGSFARSVREGVQ